MWGHVPTSWWLLLLSSSSILVHANFMYPTHDDLYSTYFRGFGRRLAPRQGSQFQCQGEGFFADPNDCSKFYRCVDYGQGYGLSAFEFKCSDGTVFDESITACNHPWAVNGPCRANQVSSEEMQSGPPQGPVTGGGPPPPAPESAPEPAPSQPNDEFQGSPSNLEDENINEIEGASTGMGGDTKSPECNSEGFFADPNNCNKFYRCVAVEGSAGFDIYRFDCGPGTVFDEENQVCAHPRDVAGECGNYEAANAEPEPSGPGEMNEDTPTNQQPGESNPKAPENNGDNSQPPTDNSQPPTDNSQPPTDNSQPPTDNSQPPTDNSQPPTDNSQPPTDNNSSGSQGTTSNTESSSEAAPGSSPESSSSGENTTTPGSGNDCNKPTYKGECEEEGFFAVAGDCAKFYRCVSNGKPGSFSKYDFECGEGTVFDPDNNVCNHASAVERDCDNPPQPQTMTTVQPQEGNENGGPPPPEDSGTPPPPPPEDSGTSPSSPPEDSGTPPPPEDPKDPGTTTSPSEEGTTKSPGDTGSGNSGNCTEEGFFPHPDNCKKFYRCVDNEKGGFDKYDFDCGEGTVFDPETSVCNHERDVQRDCSSSGTSGGPPPESDNQTAETTTVNNQSSEGPTESPNQPESPTSQPGETTPASPSGETTPASPSGETTPASSSGETATDPNPNGEEGTTKSPGGQSGDCTEEGFFPHPEDCKKFYRCVDNGKGGLTKYDFDCAEGTVFDPEINVCNHERDVQRDCSSTGTTQSPPPGDEGTTQGTTMPPDGEMPGTTTASNIPDEQPDPEKTTPMPGGDDEEPTPPISPPCHPIDPNPPVVSCTMEGYYPDPSNCSNFYRCIDHNKDGQLISVYFFRCPGPKIYDPERNVCDKPDNIKPPRDCSALTTTVAPETTTTPPDSETTTASPEDTTTPQATTESATTQPPSDETTTEPPQTTTAPPPEETTTEQVTTTQPPETTTGAPETTTQPGETTTPSSTDETPFETTTENTDEPMQTTTPMSVPPSDNSTTDAPPTSCDCCNLQEGESAFICPTGFRRHPKFCNRFYQCSSKDDVDIKVLVFDCPEGLLFDTEMQKCVEPGQTTPCQGEIGETPPSSARSRNSKVPVKVGRNALCPNTGFYTYDGDCHHFIQCREDAKGNLRGQLKRCPDGFTFWEVSRRCELTARIAKKCNRRSNDVMAWDIPVDFGNIGRLSRQLLRMI